MQLKKNIKIEILHKIMERRTETALHIRGIENVKEDVKLHIKEELDILEDVGIYGSSLIYSISRRIYG